ncbi:MAG: hypothetical protein JSR45_15345 [Proteobacteria bacterium]|nr:hypothetical protein [Pseudomonadota bacterium]
MAVNGIAVLDTVGAAVRFARANTRYAIGPLTLMAVSATLNVVGTYTGIKWLGLAGFLQLIGSLMAMGVLLRRAFADSWRDKPEDKPGAAGFQWSGHEWRLLGSGVLLWVVLFGLIIAGVVVAMIMLAATGALGSLSSFTPNTTPEEFGAMLGPQRVLGLVVLSILFAVVLIWITMRLALYAPATVYTRSVAVFSSWGLTKGRFWGVFLVLLLASLPSLVMSFVVAGIERLLGHGAGMGPVGLDLPVAIGLGAATAIVAAYIQLPLTVGASAQLYKKLAGAQVEAF